MLVLKSDPPVSDAAPNRNAEKQRRFRERHVVTLTADAPDIAEKLMGMDEAKLRKVFGYLKNYLKNPEPDPVERRLLATGRMRPWPATSWRVEAITVGGKRWTNGVRVRTKREAEAYAEHFARFDLEKAGYVIAEVSQEDCPPNGWISFRGRVVLRFFDGTCVLQTWATTGS
jgi:hypothetical protein